MGASQSVTKTVTRVIEKNSSSLNCGIVQNVRQSNKVRDIVVSGANCTVRMRNVANMKANCDISASINELSVLYANSNDEELKEAVTMSIDNTRKTNLTQKELVRKLSISCATHQAAVQTEEARDLKCAAENGVIEMENIFGVEAGCLVHLASTIDQTLTNITKSKREQKGLG
eukprot:346997-Pleurochrysis_carterae.AAC.1